MDDLLVEAEPLLIQLQLKEESLDDIIRTIDDDKLWLNEEFFDLQSEPVSGREASYHQNSSETDEESSESATNSSCVNSDFTINNHNAQTSEFEENRVHYTKTSPRPLERTEISPTQANNGGIPSRTAAGVLETSIASKTIQSSDLKKNMSCAEIKETIIDKVNEDIDCSSTTGDCEKVSVAGVWKLDVSLHFDSASNLSFDKESTCSFIDLDSAIDFGASKRDGNGCLDGWKFDDYQGINSDTISKKNGTDSINVLDLTSCSSTSTSESSWDSSMEPSRSDHHGKNPPLTVVICTSANENRFKTDLSTISSENLSKRNNFIGFKRKSHFLCSDEGRKSRETAIVYLDTIRTTKNRRSEDKVSSNDVPEDSKVLEKPLLKDTKVSNTDALNNSSDSKIIELKTQSEGEKRNWKCFICSREFSMLKLLKNHLKSHRISSEQSNPDANGFNNNNSQCECGVCGNDCGEQGINNNTCKTYCKNLNILETTRLNNGGDLIEPKKKLFQCQYCCKEFSLSKYLKKHSKSNRKNCRHRPTDEDNPNNKQLECEVCNKKFSEQTALSNHHKIHSDKKLYTCEICGKQFLHCSYLTKHSRLHSGEAPFRCKNCGKTFKDAGNLTRHCKTIHDGETPYTCPVCSQRFKQMGAYKGHLRIHTGEKPFECKTCGKCFTQSSSLKKHTMAHMGQKPHICLVCGKAFTQSTSLTEHSRSHTGERPHECPLCGKTFRKSGSLNDHLRGHSGIKPYECLFCKRRFTVACNLTRHLKNHKNMQ